MGNKLDECANANVFSKEPQLPCLLPFRSYGADIVAGIYYEILTKYLQLNDSSVCLPKLKVGYFKT